MTSGYLLLALKLDSHRLMTVEYFLTNFLVHIERHRSFSIGHDSHDKALGWRTCRTWRIAAERLGDDRRAFQEKCKSPFEVFQDHEAESYQCWIRVM